MFQENAGSNFFLTGAKTIWGQLKWLILVIWAWCYFTNKNCYQCFIIRETARSQLFLYFRCKADLWRRIFRLICVFEINIKSVTNSGKLHGLVNLFFFLSGAKPIWRLTPSFTPRRSLTPATSATPASPRSLLSKVIDLT